ncbi:MAG TPA: bifunctional 2-polyprenyl-6-hydroxyphenol methylase/3-demethylubiquinol 3-O-methyltransferase UbiG [Bauldia sp.]|nr:bifunctional 2-polyprenyl-6-hydroxyphenol methylase/3-demethylubiquinol 3-O-methyltransferase UbiG [Bauldia sp.]
MTQEARTSTVDREEIARFEALAAKWWDERGPMAPLHKFNPLRLQWIKGRIAERFGRNPQAPDALAGLRILDVGCGAGLIDEPLARMGASVTGIDPTEKLIAAAKVHAAASGLTIDYRAVEAEALAAAGEQFDVVLILEVVEHVTNVTAFVATAASLVRPGGLLVASTINRTIKAFVLAIVGAEYVLRWLPRGTHTYDKLVTPQELRAAFTTAGVAPADETGVMYVPFVDEFRLTSDMDVNYMMTATKA